MILPETWISLNNFNRKFFIIYNEVIGLVRLRDELRRENSVFANTNPEIIEPLLEKFQDFRPLIRKYTFIQTLTWDGVVLLRGNPTKDDEHRARELFSFGETESDRLDQNLEEFKMDLTVILRDVMGDNEITINELLKELSFPWLLPPLPTDSSFNCHDITRNFRSEDHPSSDEPEPDTLEKDGETEKNYCKAILEKLDSDFVNTDFEKLQNPVSSIIISVCSGYILGVIGGICYVIVLVYQKKKSIPIQKQR
jgi:hypothetical protein